MVPARLWWHVVGSSQHGHCHCSGALQHTCDPEITHLMLWDRWDPLISQWRIRTSCNKLHNGGLIMTNKVTNYGLINWILFCLCFTSRLGCWCINMAKLQVYWTSLCPALTVRCSISRSLDVGDEFWSWNMKDCENCPRQRRRIRSYKYIWMYKIYELFQLNLWFPRGYCLLQLLICKLLHLS